MPASAISSGPVGQSKLHAEQTDPKACIPSLLPWASNLPATVGAVKPLNGLKTASQTSPPNHGGSSKNGTSLVVNGDI